MFGKYGEGGETLPRVITLSVSRYRPELPQPGEGLDFLVGIHEEGTGVAWQRNVTLDPAVESSLLKDTADLYRWSLGLGLGPAEASKRVESVGRQLYESFIGPEGEEYLAGAEPTALLMAVDETILNLPWELVRSERGVLSQSTPFGRIVSTRMVPRPGRDPLREDRIVRMLAVGDPTSDLTAALAELERVRGLAGPRGPFTVEVEVLEQEDASIGRFEKMVRGGDYDMIHFAGHARFDQSTPESSALQFADGALTADDVLELEWSQPPSLVFNSACESGRAAGGRRLADGARHANGLASAFLAAGTAAYVGYFWPVSDVGAARFAEVFYESLFMLENVGLACREARRVCIDQLGDTGDLTGYSAVLFGDAASDHRRDLAMAV
ncbi:MAG: CHAT domain-containing protein [Acidimicrobiia bacterium]|nr:CHAT domain-containing protein [Acidimicrobiia bacterium]